MLIKVIFLNKNHIIYYYMFNPNEHILHLYECIDEIRDDIQELRHRQILNEPLREPPLFNPYNPAFLEPEFDFSNLNSRAENRRTRSRNNTGINWSVERNSTSRPHVSNRSNETAGPAGPNRTRGPVRNNTTSERNRSRLLTGITSPPSPLNESIEFTFYEPQISNVRQRIDTLLARLRQNNLTATGVDPINIPGDNDNETRRLTLEEINNGCETKIHSGEPEICTICREPINDQSIVREIKNCRHKFHLHCIDIWFENRRTCPICRGEVVLTPSTNNSNSNSNTVVNDLD
jgi:hypothetical protein